MPWSRKSRAVHLVPLWAVRSVRSLSALQGCTLRYLMFYAVLNIQMYLLCRIITVYYFIGTGVQNSILIFCVVCFFLYWHSTFVAGTVYPSTSTCCCCSMARMVRRTRHNIRHILYLVYYLHSCTMKVLALCMV